MKDEKFLNDLIQKYSKVTSSNIYISGDILLRKLILLIKAVLASGFLRNLM